MCARRTRRTPSSWSSLSTAPGVRAILAEKPLALDAATARALAARARECGVVLAVNYTRRFAPAFRRLQPGEVQHVSASM